MTPITRLHYRERQRLRTADLTDEQRYLNQARRRHNITHHVWGIVWGLALTRDEFGRPVIQPGIAIDGYGRELIVSAPIQITRDDLKSLAHEWGEDATSLDVWLVYNEVLYTPPQRGRVENCYDTRISEQACLRFTLGIEGATVDDRRQPDVVDEAELDFQRWQTPPDDWMHPWPVYLGQLIKNADRLLLDMNNRPYAELIGERVTTPSGQGWMELLDVGGITRRFSVNLADNKAVITKRLDVQYSDSMRETQAAISGNPTIEKIVGGKPAESKLKIGGAPNIEPLMPVDARGLHFDSPRLTPEKAVPWQIYRTLFTPKDPPPGTKPQDQLRLEIFDPGQEGDETAYGFSIGHWYSQNGKNDFEPCLRLTANCTVELSGALTVNGEILQSPVPADPKDPRFAKAMLGMWLKGIASASKLLDEFYNTVAQGDSDLKMIFNNDIPATINLGGRISYTANLRNAGTVALNTLVVKQFVISTNLSNLTPTSVHTPGTTISPAQSLLLNPDTITPSQVGPILVVITATALTPDRKPVNSIGMKLVSVLGSILV